MLATFLGEVALTVNIVMGNKIAVSACLVNVNSTMPDVDSPEQARQLSVKDDMKPVVEALQKHGLSDKDIARVQHLILSAQQKACLSFCTLLGPQVRADGACSNLNWLGMPLTLVPAG